MPLVRAIIFDFDGTFAPQTNRLHFLAFKHAFQRVGYVLQEKDLAPLMGVPQLEIIRTLLPGAEEITVQKVNRAKMREYFRLISKERIPRTSIKTAETLKKRGFKIAISSGSYVKPVKRLLPKHLMDDLTTAEEVHRPKPDPEILLKTARDIKVLPDQCAYVGDSWRDREAARAAEMVFVGVLAYLTSEQMVASQPDILIGGLPELLRIFKSAPQELTL